MCGYNNNTVAEARGKIIKDKQKTFSTQPSGYLQICLTLLASWRNPIFTDTNLAYFLPGLHRAEAAGGAAGDHGVAGPEAGVLAVRHQGHLPLHAAAVRHADLVPEAEKGEQN